MFVFENFKKGISHMHILFTLLYCLVQRSILLVVMHGTVYWEYFWLTAYFWCIQIATGNSKKQFKPHRTIFGRFGHYGCNYWYSAYLGAITCVLITSIYFLESNYPSWLYLMAISNIIWSEKRLEFNMSTSNTNIKALNKHV